MNVLQYFRLRKAWDAKERVASGDVVLLKESQQRYAGCNIDEMYEEWRNGVVGDSDVMCHKSGFVELRKGTFRTLVCGSSLKVFSDPLENDAENLEERDSLQRAGQDSGETSIQVSGS